MSVAVLSVVVTAYQFQALSSAPGLVGAGFENLTPLPQFKILVSTLSEAFFAFLVAAIFAMIRTKSAANRGRSDRLMHLTCAGYALTGLIGLGSWLHWMLTSRFNFACADCGFGVEALQWGGLGLMGLATLTPFIYAITVFVLYTQLTRLVNFEAEVI